MHTGKAVQAAAAAPHAVCAHNRCHSILKAPRSVQLVRADRERADRLTRL